MGRQMRSENDECSFRMNEGKCIVIKLFCCCINTPNTPPPQKKIKMPQLVPHGLGGEFHNLTLEHFEHINSA